MAFDYRAARQDILRDWNNIKGSRGMLQQKISSYYQSLIDADGPGGPLARMLYASTENEKVRPGELTDPIGDETHCHGANGRIIHRYADRVLILVTDKCAAHCRFCFRKRLVGAGGESIGDSELQECLDYIAMHSEVKEAILSGGDPLSLSNERLIEIIEALQKTGVSVRLHTRYPVYEPSRCKNFEEVARRIDTFIVHVNHHKEITPEFCEAAGVLKQAKLLLNQSVLLKGVNDSVDELEALSRGLSSVGIAPHYLHYPDLAPGTAGFRIPLDEALALMEALKKRLARTLVPKLILDLPEGKGKLQISEGTLRKISEGRYLVNSPLDGKPAEYREVL